MGKPVNADLTLGLATAPVFFALQEDESMRALILRGFQQPGDVEKVRVAKPPLNILLNLCDVTGVAVRPNDASIVPYTGLS